MFKEPVEVLPCVHYIAAVTLKVRERDSIAHSVRLNILTYQMRAYNHRVPIPTTAVKV